MQSISLEDMIKDGTWGPNLSSVLGFIVTVQQVYVF